MMINGVNAATSSNYHQQLGVRRPLAAPSVRPPFTVHRHNPPSTAHRQQSTPPPASPLLLSTVYHPQFSVQRLLSTVYRPLSIANRLPSAECPLSTVCHLLSAVCRLSTTVCRLPSADCRLPCLMSAVKWLTFHKR